MALHIENFSDDFDPTQLGYDSSDADPLTIPGGDTDADPNTTLGPDEFLIPHQTSTGQVFLIYREDPGVASFALAVSGAADWYETNFAANRNLPGGLGQDEVAAVGIEFFGAGTILFVGENGVKTVTTRNWSSWDRVTVTSNDPSDSGAELGPIERVRVTVDATSVPRGMVVDNIAVLVVDSGFSNNPPEAANDFKSTLPGQPVPVDFMANDGDPDGDPISFVSFRKLPSFGHITVTPHPTTNRPIATYTPDAGFHGVDSFEYEITDSRGTPPGVDTGSVQIIVNTPPPAPVKSFFPPHLHSGPFSVPAPGILTGVTDADGDSLTFELVGEPSLGDVTLEPDGSFIYVPDDPTGLVFNDQFEFRLRDPFTVGETAVALIRTRNAPPVALGGVIAAEHGAPSPLRGSLPVSDPDGDTLTPHLVQNVAHGRIIRIEVVNGRLEFDYETFLGRAIGPDRFTYRLFDGVAYSDAVTVEIAIPNYPPVAHPDLYARYAGDPDDWEFIRGNVLQPGPVYYGYDDSVLVAETIDRGVDVDQDNDPLEVVEITQQPAYGTLVSWSANGDFVYRLPSQFPVLHPDTGEPTGLFDEIGVDSFQYRVTDGYASAQATVTLWGFGFADVWPADRNSVEYPYPLRYEISPGHTLHRAEELGLWSFDGSARYDHPQFEARVEDLPNHGTLSQETRGAFTYEPQPGFVGVDQLLVSTVLDVEHALRILGPAQMRLYRPVTITVRNDAPELQPDAYSTFADEAIDISADEGVLANDFDRNSQRLSVDEFTDPPHGRIVHWTAEGAFRYVPDPGYSGSDSFTYRVTDGSGGAGRATVTVTVLPTHRPRLMPELHFTGADNVPVPIAPSPLIGELAWSDDDGDAVTPLILPDHRPRHGRAELRVVGNHVRVEYYPHNGHFAPYDEFRVAVTDGVAQSQPAVIRVTREDNTPPTAQNDFFVIQNRPVGVADTDPVLFAFPGVTWNDQDPDDDFLIVTLVSSPAHGALMLEDDGRFIYRPHRDYVGTDTFVYRVDDGSGITSQATVTMRVLDEFVATAFDDLRLSEWGGELIPADIVPEEFTDRAYGTFIVDNDVLPADWQHWPAPVSSPSADWALRLIPRPRQVEGSNHLIVHEGRIGLDPRGWVGLYPLLQDGNGELYLSFVTGAVEVTYAFRDLNHPGYLSNFARLRIVVAPPAQGSHTLRTVQGLPGDRIGIQSSPGTVLDVADLVDPPVAPPSGMGLLYDKLINLVISDVEPGGAATVTLTYNQNLPAGATYMKYGRRDDDPSTPADESQAQWYDFSFDPITGTGAEIVGSQIILHFVDGLRGDNNRLANGVIVDPGGPVIPIDLIQGTAGDDDIHVVRAGDELAIYVNVAPTDDPTYRVPLDRITALAILGGQGDDVLTVDCGQHPALGLDRLIFNAGAGNNALVLANGSARIESAAPGGTLNTIVQAGARLTTSRLNQNALSLQSNSRVTLLPAGETSLITSLSLATGATLDIGNNAVVLDYSGDSPLAEIREKILSGRGGPGFGASWNGAGITSSAAAQANQTDPESRSIGFAENASLPLGPYATFRGQVVDNTSILIAYTRTADADLNGVVNDDDVTIVGATYAPGVPQPHWGLGDFDYNGFVDDDDVTLLGVFYNPGAAPLAVPPPAAPNEAQGPAAIFIFEQPRYSQLWDRRGELIELLAESMACDQAAQHDGLSDTCLRSGRKPRPTDNLWPGWEETIP